MNTIFKKITTISVSALLATSVLATSAFAQQNGVKNASDRAYTQPVQPLPTIQTDNHVAPKQHAPAQPTFNLNGFTPFKVSIGSGAGTNGGGLAQFLGQGFGKTNTQEFSNTNILLNAAGNGCDINCNTFGFQASVEAGQHSNALAEAAGHTPNELIQSMGQTTSNSAGFLSFNAEHLQPIQPTTGSNNP